MTLATMDSLCDGYDRADMTARFLGRLHRGEYTWGGQAIGIGRQILRALQAWERDGTPIPAARRKRRRSLMRILHACLRALGLPEEQALRRLQEISALTHAHARSIWACTLYFCCVRKLVRGTGSLQERLQRAMNRSFALDGRYGRVGAYACLADIGALAALQWVQIRSTGCVVDTWRPRCGALPPRTALLNACCAR